MSKSLQKPTILNVETVARSRLFTVESVDLEFSNGVRRVYERMRPTNREAVMIVPIVDDHLILIREYAVGTESYELGFSKGLIDPGESVYEAANRELKEEVGFGANDLTFLKKLSMAPSYFSSKMNIVVAQDLYPAEADILNSVYNEFPVMLFDDVFSELDSSRKSFIVSRIKDKQVIITACEDPSGMGDARIFSVSNGRVELV